jgi:hypothetical protein
MSLQTSNNFGDFTWRSQCVLLVLGTLNLRVKRLQAVRKADEV